MFHATNYYHMINWDTELKTQPIFLTSLSDEEILHILEESLNVLKWQTTLKQFKEKSGSGLKLAQRWLVTKQEMATSDSDFVADALCLRFVPRISHQFS